MAPVSTIKEVFFLATTSSTLSSELMSGTWAGGWNLGSAIGTTLIGLGWGSGEKWGSPQRHQGIPVDIPLSRSGRWVPLQGCQGTPRDSPSSSVPISTGWACFCGGPWVWAFFAQCPDWLHQKQGSGWGGGVVLSPGLG